MEKNGNQSKSINRNTSKTASVKESFAKGEEQKKCSGETESLAEGSEQSKWYGTTDGCQPQSSNKAQGASAGGASEVVEKEAPDGGWGWLVTFAAFTIMYMTAVTYVSFGVMFSKFLLDLGTSSTASAWVSNLTFVTSGLLSCLTCPLVDEFGWRRVAFVTSLMFGVGITISAFANSAWFLVLSYSILAGSNVMTMVIVCYLVVSHYFLRWRTAANSIMTCGVCVCQMTMPLAITYLQEQYGFMGATLITGALCLNCCAAAMVFHPTEWCREKSYTKFTTTSKEDQPSTKSTSDSARNKSTKWKSYTTITRGKDQSFIRNTSKSSESLRRILRTARQNLQYMSLPAVSLSAFVVAMMLTVIFNFYAVVPFAMHDSGFSQRESALCLSVAGGCNLASRVLTTFLSFCPGIKVRNVYLLGLFLSAVAVAAFSLVDSLIGKAVTVGLSGVGYGLAASLQGLYIVEQLGLPMLLPTFSIMGLMAVLQFLTVGPISGAIQDTSKSYAVSLGFCAACLLFAFVLGLITPAANDLDQRRRKQLPLATQAVPQQYLPHQHHEELHQQFQVSSP